MKYTCEVLKFEKTYNQDYSLALGTASFAESVDNIEFKAVYDISKKYDFFLGTTIANASSREISVKYRREIMNG